MPYKKRDTETDSPRVLSVKKENTLRMRSLVATIRARTNRARAQLDAFTKGVDMSDLDEYPVITKGPKFKSIPLPKPAREPRNNNARMSLEKPRKPTPIRTRQNRCTFCQELGHNRGGCTKRKDFEAALALKTARVAPRPEAAASP